MIFTLIMCFALCGCNTWFDNNDPVKTEFSVDVKETKEKVGDVQEKVNESADTIDNVAKDIVPENIEPSKKAIKQETNKIREATSELSKVKGDLNVVIKEEKEIFEATKKLNDKIDEQLKQIEKLQQQITDYEDGAKAKQEKIWMGVMGVCGIGFLVGVFMAVSGNTKVGTAIAISCLVGSAVAYFMAAYAWAVAIAGGVLFVIAFVMVIQYMYKYKKAVIETATTMEFVKSKNRSNWEANKNMVKKLQSPSTSKVIREVKDLHINRN